MASPGELSPTEPSEGLYTCQNDLWSSHYVFPKIGEESGQAFCLFLQNWGIGLPAPHDGYEQFLNLQALFWRKTTAVNELDHEPPGRPQIIQTRRWTNDQTLVEHTEYIAHALEGRGSGKVCQIRGDLVFVVCDDAKKSCINISCPGAGAREAGKANSSLIITLEPLLTWGTVKAASDLRVASGKIFAVRRNGPRMNDPLWAQQVHKLVSKQARSYCLDCLEELMNRGVETQSIINQSVGRPQGARRHYLPVQPIQRPSSSSQLYDLRESKDFEDNLCSKGPVSSTTGSLHLDGVIDETPYAKPRDYRLSMGKAYEEGWTAKKNSPFVGDTVSSRASSRSQRPSRSCTPPPFPSRVDSVHSRLSSGSSFQHCLSLNNSLPPTPETSKTRNLVYEDPTSARQDLLKDSVPDFGSGSRQFGRDIDTNAVCRFFTNHRIKRENMTKARDMDTRDTGISNFFTPVNSQSSVTLRSAVKTKSVTYEESDLSDAGSEIAKEEDGSDAPYGEYTPTKTKGKARSKSAWPNKKGILSLKEKTPSPPSKLSGKVHASHAPVYRKRNPVIDNSPPSSVAQAAFETYLEHVPLKTDPICSCRKPARTFEVLITQCVNEDCRVRWYHKDCLSTRGKLQARHGTYLCEQCQNERHYENMSRVNVWTTKKLVQNEIGMPFTGREMAGTLGNAGNFQAVEDPYGLAASTPNITLSPFAKPFTPHAIVRADMAALNRLAVGSGPSLGLETSRPYFVTEAYTRAGEHRCVADEAWESARVYDSRSDEQDDEMGEGDEGDKEDEAGTEL